MAAEPGPEGVRIPRPIIFSPSLPCARGPLHHPAYFTLAVTDRRFFTEGPGTPENQLKGSVPKANRKKDRKKGRKRAREEEGQKESYRASKKAKIAQCKFVWMGQPPLCNRMRSLCERTSAAES